MNKNYSIIPFKNFNCSQNYNGAYSHATQSHSTNGVKSYPIDVVDDIYCGCDEMECVKINGVGNGTVNQLFVSSTTPVIMPDGQFYITYLITHPNDADIKANAWIGKKYHRGDLIIHMGTDGGVGAHIDLVTARGRQNTWVQNSYGEWVLPNSFIPEGCFFYDKNFTKLTNLQEMTFRTLPSDAYFNAPSPVSRDENKRQLQVDYNDNLRIRQTPNGNILGILNKGIYNFSEEKDAAGYKWVNIGNGWCAITDMSHILEAKKIEMPNPVSRDTNKEQLQVDYDDNLRVRKTPNGDVLGILNKGIYNFTQKCDKDGYKWVQLCDNMWCAITDMSHILEIEKPKEETKIEEPIKEEVVIEDSKKEEVPVISCNEESRPMDTNADQLEEYKTFKCKKTDYYYIRLEEGQVLKYIVKDDEND